MQRQYAQEAFGPTKAIPLNANAGIVIPSLPAQAGVARNLRLPLQPDQQRPAANFPETSGARP
jgi:hypothetical protein